MYAYQGLLKTQAIGFDDKKVDDRRYTMRKNFFFRSTSGSFLQIQRSIVYSTVLFFFLDSTRQFTSDREKPRLLWLFLRCVVLHKYPLRCVSLDLWRPWCFGNDVGVEEQGTMFSASPGTMLSWQRKDSKVDIQGLGQYWSIEGSPKDAYTLKT